MREIKVFFIRHTRLFFRDKTAVFFSLLSSLIVVFLYILFIANSYIDGMEEAGIPLTTSEMHFLIYNLVFSSVVIINSISIPVAVLTIMAKDFETKKIDGFLLTRISPQKLLLSYILSAFCVTAVLNLATFVFGTLLVGAFSGVFLSFEAIALGIYATLLISLVSSMIMALIVTLVRSTSALNVVSGVAGTFFGFLCGIFMPYRMLGDGMKAVGSLFPFTHLTIWFKKIILNDVFKTFALKEEMREAISESFSAQNVGFLGLDIPLLVLLIISGVIALACLFVAALLLKKQIIKNQRN